MLGWCPACCRPINLEEGSNTCKQCGYTFYCNLFQVPQSSLSPICQTSNWCANVPPVNRFAPNYFSPTVRSPVSQGNVSNVTSPASPRDVSKELYLACLSGDIVSVNSLLASPANMLNINRLDEGSGMGPLHVACQQGHAVVVKALLSVPEIDIYSTTRDGRSPIAIAQEQNHVEIINLLQQHNMRQTLRNAYAPLKKP